MKKRRANEQRGWKKRDPFEGMSKVNQNAAGVDIGATEIVACVSGGDEVQLVKAFGNYTVDLQAIARWFRRAWDQDGGDGKHRGVLDSAV